ncbi:MULTISPECIES: HAD-IIA family hydrolase [Streptomyces]|uniref:HAD-IIA family hydrolase n=1 Tax=Streptomyces TaxID=1883 RepID=UPI001E58B04C|nr:MULTISPECIES: HAD-IIA family hydrolase [Streptomyces]UFQ19500.1 HAD-IIA family hydrolase [Streptomyces huasconensis]WCL89119.1 HAD-IIA family hydrolase [Streptomyces sp. JCM 35825]
MTRHSAVDGEPLPLPLARAYDTALLDLDGVVYVGPYAVEHAAPSLARAEALGMRLAYVTNNAYRTPRAVGEHLRRLGLPVAEDDVVTSAQAAARLAAELRPPVVRVLAIGGEGLLAALRAHGLEPVRSADDEPDCVVQGFAPTVSWRELAEAAYAVGRGVPWIVTNADPNAPTHRGTAPGNGALAGVVRAATGAVPLVAGKPAAALLREGAARTGARRPLMVGDRLDTDVEGARTAGFDSLVVLTGATTPYELLTAPEHQRPTHLAADLRGLLAPARRVEEHAGGFRCGGWRGHVCDGELVLKGRGDREDALWVACRAAWSAPEPPCTATALAALARCALG